MRTVCDHYSDLYTTYRYRNRSSCCSRTSEHGKLQATNPTTSTAADNLVMSTTATSAAVDDLVEQADELCDVHDHITRVIANLDIPRESFSDQYSHPGQAQFDFKPAVRMFLYQYAREFNDSELTRRLKGTASTFLSAFAYLDHRLSRVSTTSGGVGCRLPTAARSRPLLVRSVK
jgi:hypothetical protein